MRRNKRKPGQPRSLVLSYYQQWMIGEEDPKMLKGYRHLRRIMDRLDRLSAPEKVAQAARIKAAQCRLLSIVRIVRQRHPHPESVSEHTFFVLLRDREEQAAKKKAQG